MSEEQFKKDMDQARRLLKKLDAYNIARKENPPAYDIPPHEALKLMLMDEQNELIRNQEQKYNTSEVDYYFYSDEKNINLKGLVEIKVRMDQEEEHIEYLFNFDRTYSEYEIIAIPRKHSHEIEWAERQIQEYFSYIEQCRDATKPYKNLEFKIAGVSNV